MRSLRSLSIHHLSRPMPIDGRSAYQLRGLTWLHAALHGEGLNPHAFSRKYMDENSVTSRLIYKWLDRSASPSRRLVENISVQLPKYFALYDLPLFRLLDSRTLTTQQIFDEVKRYRHVSQGIPCWRFPGDNERNVATVKKYTPIYFSERLLLRGDIYGFMAITALARWADAIGNDELFLCYCANAYRAYPIIARSPEFRSQEDLLKVCLAGLSNRRYVTRALLKINWDTINEQINDPSPQAIGLGDPDKDNFYRSDTWNDPVEFVPIAYSLNRKTLLSSR